ncbi:hypothetical protein A2Z67_03915 [Candidatus Woesebacteria bacterium RBG_13_36_22]|uniref:Putative phage metallopeptidase domain-containing protein n=1 Tax=Candidatus Woesebacteria bacterium RBG_13_36_22 TaxID=1802478 RepID=A0A1F7X1I0_9BACT|nr:MAG: hypothetical protein A2Z67_03915 [Candidatus Woesebacteria bacterium RBG_13_36_22]
MQYEFAPEVEEVAKPIVGAYHKHLEKANISYIFRDKAWKNFDSRVVLGRAAKRNELDQLLSPKREDFVIIVGKDRWEKMTDVEKRYLVDHELCHCGISVDAQGGTKFVVRGHVIEEFPENLARFEHRRQMLGKLIENPPSPISVSQNRKIEVGE